MDDSSRGVPRIFHWGATSEGPKAESGDGVTGEGQQPLPTSYGV